MTDTLGARLTDLEELLHRQVHPSFVDGGRVSSQAFRPIRGDIALLSVARGQLATPNQAYERYAEQGGASAGVWSISVGECAAEGLTAHEDPIVEPTPDPAHAVVDFRGRSKRDVEATAKRLAVKAIARGCQYARTD